MTSKGLGASALCTTALEPAMYCNTTNCQCCLGDCAVGLGLCTRRARAATTHSLSCPIPRFPVARLDCE